MNCKPLFILLAAVYLTGCAIRSPVPDDGFMIDKELRALQVKRLGDTPDTHRFVDLLLKVAKQGPLDDELRDWARLAYGVQPQDQTKEFLETLKEVMKKHAEPTDGWFLTEP